jgi:hypothetical protein
MCADGSVAGTALSAFRNGSALSSQVEDLDLDISEVQDQLCVVYSLQTSLALSWDYVALLLHSGLEPWHWQSYRVLC